MCKGDEEKIYVNVVEGRRVDEKDWKKLKEGSRKAHDERARRERKGGGKSCREKMFAEEMKRKLRTKDK